MTSDERHEAKIVGRIRAALPQTALEVDAWLSARGMSIEDGEYMWMDGLSNLTMEALRLGEYDRATTHMRCLCALLESADEATIRFIDVGYVEGLMWDMDDKQKKTGVATYPGPAARAVCGFLGTAMNDQAPIRFGRKGSGSVPRIPPNEWRRRDKSSSNGKPLGKHQLRADCMKRRRIAMPMIRTAPASVDSAKIAEGTSNASW